MAVECMKTIQYYNKHAQAFYNRTINADTEERDFYNMTEDSILHYFNDFFDVLEIWKEKDNRSKVSPSKDGMWLIFTFSGLIKFSLTGVRPSFAGIGYTLCSQCV